MTESDAGAGRPEETGRRPLVSFVLAAYNQEDFIREAVEGAFSQTYRPLEIILSDDCSEDGTFEIMRSMASEYDGPHTVKLNRNEVNLGLGPHLNHILGSVSSDFVVAAAGDDISLACRTEKLVQVWLDSGRQIKSIHSSAIEIDRFSRKSSRLIRGNFPDAAVSMEDICGKYLYIQGCAHAWDMDIFRLFGPILPGVVNEDVVLPFRAKLIGDVGFVDEPLVQYRKGVGGVSEQGARGADGRKPRKFLQAIYMSDVQKRLDSRNYPLSREALTSLRALRSRHLMRSYMASGRRITFRKLSYFRTGCSLYFIMREYLRYRMTKTSNILIIFGRIVKLRTGKNN